MLLIHCPYCDEARPELEFRYAGEAHLARPPEAADDATFGAFLYVRQNTRGVLAERWRHAHGCGRYFNALRHSVSDAFICTYRADEPRPETES